MDDSVFDELIINKPGTYFYDVTPLFSDGLAFSYAIDRMVEELGDVSDVTKIVCPAEDTTFAAALAYRLHVGLVILNPYDGLIRADGSLDAGDRALIVGTALCGGSLYYSMYNLIIERGAEVVGLAFLLEKLFHRGRYKLMDLISSSLPHGVKSVVKYGVTIGNYVRFDCSARGLGIREFRVLRVMDDEIGINWFDGPTPCEKIFPKTRIIEVSQNKMQWFKYRP